MVQAPNDPLSERACGVLLHPSSLPSRWGVGDIGATARDFAASLATAAQRYWQVLPLNPTSGAAGDSPYFSTSSRAGNPLLISLEDLVEDGLLPATALAAPLDASAGRVDFTLARRHKLPLLRRAADMALTAANTDSAFTAFCERERAWLDEHALFTALHAAHDDGWSTWPQALRFLDPKALAAARRDHRRAIATEKWLQYAFDRQWKKLRQTCAAAGVALFGDVPIYVNYDSVDVWARPEVFQLDAELRPVAESGVPPDYFSTTGQLWRNPVYDWHALQKNDFDWWIHRIGTLLERFDVLRIDHFRGLAQFWEVPAGSETAIDGRWSDVPSEAFFDALQQHFDTLPLVAEDLGTITPDVHELRDRYGLPGMVVLQFAFDGDPHNAYLPQHHPENTVAYLGTHDNNTACGWYEGDLDDAGRQRVTPYLEGRGDTPGLALLDLLLSSPSRTAIVTAQDLLQLGADARMNTPGLESGNWRWQLTEAQLAALPWDWLKARCARHGRQHCDA